MANAATTCYCIVLIYLCAMFDCGHLVPSPCLAPPPALPIIPPRLQVCASMSDLCHDLVGTEPRKRKAEELPEEQRALIDRTGCGGQAAKGCGQGCTEWSA